MSDGPVGSTDGELEGAAGAAAVPSICPANDDDADAEQDAFTGSAEDVAAEETRRKIELFAWADGVLGLNEADLELALEDVFGNSRSQRSRWGPCAACLLRRRLILKPFHSLAKSPSQYSVTALVRAGCCCHRPPSSAARSPERQRSPAPLLKRNGRPAAGAGGIGRAALARRIKSLVRKRRAREAAGG
jgi:hypothetical protein